jgi:type IV secretion system protein VirB6
MFAAVLAQVDPITGPNLFRHLGKAFAGAFEVFLAPTVSSLVEALQLTALVGCTLYILVMGLTIVFGAESAPFYTFLRTSLKIVIVAAFALSAEGYLGGVVEALKGLETGLVHAMNRGADRAPDTLYAQIDLMLKEGFDRTMACFEVAYDKGVWNPGAAISWALAALFFGVAVAAVAVFGGSIVLLSKMALTILFALGPVFVLCLMFPQTTGFFHRWFGEVLSFTLQNVIVSVVLSFSLEVFKSFISTTKIEDSGDVNIFIAALQVAVMGFVMVYFLAKSGALASGLSGGAGSSAVSAQGLGGMYLSAAKAAKGLLTTKPNAGGGSGGGSSGAKNRSSSSRAASHGIASWESGAPGGGTSPSSSPQAGGQNIVISVGGGSSPPGGSPASPAVKGALSKAPGSSGPSSAPAPLQRCGVSGVRAQAIANFSAPGGAKALPSSKGPKPSTPGTTTPSPKGPAPAPASNKPKETR